MKIVKISKDHCVPCKQVGQFLDSIGVKYEEINIMENPQIASKYGIMSVPVVMLLDDNGDELKCVVGNNIEQIKKLIEIYNKHI